MQIFFGNVFADNLSLGQNFRLLLLFCRHFYSALKEMAFSFMLLQRYLVIAFSTNANTAKKVRVSNQGFQLFLSLRKKWSYEQKLDWKESGFSGFVVEHILASLDTLQNTSQKFCYGHWSVTTSRIRHVQTCPNLLEKMTPARGKFSDGKIIALDHVQNDLCNRVKALLWLQGRHINF